jgi:hypothetical protein
MDIVITTNETQASFFDLRLLIIPSASSIFSRHQPIHLFGSYYIPLLNYTSFISFIDFIPLISLYVLLTIVFSVLRFTASDDPFVYSIFFITQWPKRKRTNTNLQNTTQKKNNYRTNFQLYLRYTEL